MRIFLGCSGAATNRLPLTAGAFIAVLLLALLACRSHETRISGSLTLDGAPFQAVECRTMQFESSAGGSSRMTRWVTFIDAAGRRVQFTESAALGVMRVQYFPAAGAEAIDTGERCGSMSISSGSGQGSVAMSGTITANCRGGGHSVQASVSFAHCGPHGRGP